MNSEDRIADFEKRVAALEKKAAAATTAVYNLSFQMMQQDVEPVINQLK